MVAVHSVESAESLLAESIGARPAGREHLPIMELADAIRDFSAIRFDVPQSVDADGFLFQYGRASWLERPTFVCGFTRQFEIVDDDGEYECYSQVSVEYRYSMDDYLRTVTGRETWWFYSSATMFEGWLEENLSDPIWAELQVRRIIEVAISREIV